MGTRLAVIRPPWLWPVTPMRLRSTTPMSTALSTAALASAVQLLQVGVVGGLGVADDGELALSMIA
jgi:hypothetical protein